MAVTYEKTFEIEIINELSASVYNRVLNYVLNHELNKNDSQLLEVNLLNQEQYFRQFGHGVPREMLPDSISTEQIKQAMKKCILSKKDNLFELLGIIINDNYLY